MLCGFSMLARADAPAIRQSAGLSQLSFASLCAFASKVRPQQELKPRTRPGDASHRRTASSSIVRSGTTQFQRPGTTLRPSDD